MDGEFRFQTGETVTDKVSGLHGTIISRAESIDGYRQYEVQPGADRDGKPQDAKWLGEGRLTQLR